MITKVAVLGAGTMGHSIANNFASHGVDVHLYESFDQVRETVKDRIKAEMEMFVEEGYFEVDNIQKTLDHITLFADLEEAVRDVEFVIEAVPEILDLKQELFEKLDQYCGENVILASNTSSLKLWDMMARVSEERKTKVMIAHCYNPAHLIPIIELSYFGNMSEEDFESVRELFVRCEKAPVKVLKDVTGMVANRLLHAQAREAFYLIDQGIASAEDVDRALMYGPAFRNATTGMLEVADMGGLDIWYAAESNFFPNLCAETKPSETMHALVEEGHYGIKTGKGFFDYPEEIRGSAVEKFYRRLIVQMKASRQFK
ncbi:MAG: 3-hydroxyacyl-CoA dehydrogenase family protein [Firmicutes bacterium]|nr:3-hydroxyacyl-CoA dehydrogenase family protein [Bacillota bacterium]